MTQGVIFRENSRKTGVWNSLSSVKIFRKNKQSNASHC